MVTNWAQEKTKYLLEFCNVYLEETHILKQQRGSTEIFLNRALRGIKTLFCGQTSEVIHGHYTCPLSEVATNKFGAVPKRFLGNQSKLDTLLKLKYKMDTMRKSIKDIKGLALNGFGGTAVIY